MKALVICLIAAFGLAAALAGATSKVAEPSRNPLPLSRPVSVNVVFWDQERGFKSVADNLDLISEVNPFWYTLDKDGSIIPYRRNDGTSYEDPAMVAKLQREGISILPTIANTYQDDIWPRALVTNLLYNSNKRAEHIKNIVDLAVNHNYDGINLDYENLDSSDRQIFSAFVGELATALHAEGKKLNVAVYAKTSEPGSWDGPQAQDYRYLGQVADKVVIMLYNYHWGGSVAGPITPAAWERDVLQFASRVIPPHKLSHGIALFGYDWVGKRGQDATWQEHTNTASAKGATFNWSTESEAPWFSYLENGVKHEVWYENALSLRGHLRRSIYYNTGDINLWRLGGEDPANWQTIRELLVQSM